MGDAMGKLRQIIHRYHLARFIRRAVKIIDRADSVYDATVRQKLLDLAAEIERVERESR